MESESENILSKCFAEEVPITSINYKGLFVPDSYKFIAELIENFEVREDDTWICSFPKTGTTWTQEMVWGIVNGLDSEAAKLPLIVKFPFVEGTGTTTFGWVHRSLNRSDLQLPEFMTKSVEYAANQPSPRFLKTHLPFHLLPRQLRTGEKKCKIIYVARNAKDACISYYHHYKLLDAYVSTFENFCKLFLADKVYYAPFWEHVIGYWEKKDEMNILFLKYEDMKSNLSLAVEKTAKYLCKSLNEYQIEELTDHLSFEKMKSNPVVNYESVTEIVNSLKMFGKNFVAEGEFFRKGTAGQWKTAMSKEMIDAFDKWTAEKLKNNKCLLDEFS